MNSQSNSTSNATPVGLSDPQYTSRRKRMFEFLTRVCALGADVDLDIPSIAVIGWQSAGKSSLIEAISGITLPRASGTCTRCPTECQLSHSDSPWTCTISLQLNSAADGSALANSQKVQFGPPITEKSEVTERIQRAQRALLNPSQPPDVFLSGADSGHEVSFSSNRIVVHVSGPDITDLNFIDLPGMFVGGDENEMNLIKKMAISYIEKPSCIILLTVACETDFVNQGSHRLAQEYDPSGSRTIGVLTKPDRIPKTEEENWLPLIRGERGDTTLWFCVKCPSSQQISSGITWEEAREREVAFFSRTSPWSMLDNAFKQRLGTGRLTRCLSDKLCDLIAERLPNIERELNKCLEKINRDLEDLPPPPSSAPLKDVLRLVTDFTGAVKKQGEGVPGRHGLLQQMRPPQEGFRIAIRKTAPCFIPQFSKRHTSERPVDKNTEEVEEDDEGFGLFSSDEPLTRVVTPRLSQVSPVAVHVTAPCFIPLSSKRHTDERPVDENTEEVSEDGHDSSLSEDGNAPTPPFLIGEEKDDEAGLSDGKSIFVDDVLENAERAVTRELPHNYPFIVQKNYILAFVDKWDDPAQALFISTNTKLREITLRVVNDHFGNHTHGHLKQRVSTIVTTYLEQCSKETSKRIKFLLDVEKEPSAPNTYYFKDYRRKFLSFYNGLYHSNSNDRFIERLQGRVYQSPQFSRALETVMSNLRIIGFRNVRPLELAALQASDDADEALRIMANVRAYFQVAFKRFVDNTVKAIDEELILGLSKGLQDALMTGLRLDLPDAHETCARLLAENPHVTEKRNNLAASQKKLLLAQEELYNALD